MDKRILNLTLYLVLAGETSPAPLPGTSPLTLSGIH